MNNLGGQSQGVGGQGLQSQAMGQFQPSTDWYPQQQQPNTGAYQPQFQPNLTPFQPNAGELPQPGPGQFGLPNIGQLHRTDEQFQLKSTQFQPPGNSRQFQPPGQFQQQAIGEQPNTDQQEYGGHQGYGGWQGYRGQHSGQQPQGFIGAPPQTPPGIELNTLKNCVESLELALSGLERSLVHFLNREEFINDSIHNRVLDPRSSLDENEKAGELVRAIRKRVKQDSTSYYTFLNKLRQYGKRYQPIIDKLEAEYAKLQSAGTQGQGEWVSMQLHG